MNIQSKKSTFIPPGGPTLEDVGLLIMASTTISPRKKGELLSAVNTTALWCHRTPAEMPADQAYIDRTFERLYFGTLGVTRARFRNVRSLVRQALKVAGVPTSVHIAAELSPDWVALRGLVQNPYTKECLGRFSRFCSAEAVAPQDVDDAVVQRFLDALIEHNLAPRPWVAAQSLVRIWNRSVDQVECWPQTKLTPLLKRETYTLDWNEVPAGLLAEIETYLEVLGGCDPLHEKAPPRPLRPRSIDKHRYGLLQLISAMKHKGVPVEDLQTLTDLCDPERVKKALSFFIERHRRRHGDDSDPATSTMIHGLADGVRTLAKHYVGAPQTVVATLTKFSNQLNRRQRGMTEKNRKRLAQLDSPILERRFLMYPEIELDKLAKKKSITRMDAHRFGVLLAIQILILAPMRSENLAELDLQMHFVWPPRRRGEIGIVIPRKNVKNAVPLDYKIPVRWVALFYNYLDRFRPLLAKNGSSALFPNPKGLPKRPDTISKQITNLVHKELGIKWNAHIFRHLAARLYKRGYPHDHEGLRQLLAHLDGETTRRAYETEDMRPALQAYDAIIEAEVGPAPRRPKKGRPER